MSTPAAPVAPALKKTALNATHRALKAKMVDFGGWDMPVEYPGTRRRPIAEHMAVRTGVGLFDVSHMGEIQFRGPGSLAAVQHITMNDASRLKDGQAHYSALLTPQGTFVDDILVHRLGDNDYLLVVNAGTKDKDYAWIRQQVGVWPGIHLNDYSSYYSQLALQGPRAQETLQKLTKVNLAAIKNYWFTWGQVAGIQNVLIARTGYSGEDGFEVYIPSDEASSVEDVECADGGGRGVRHSSLRPWRAQHPASRSRHESLRPRNLRRDQRTRSGLGSLSQARQRGVHRPRCFTRRAEKRRPERKIIGLEMIERGIARDGYTVPDPRRQADRRSDVRLARALPQDQHRHGARAHGGCCKRVDVFVQCRGNPVRANKSPCPFYKRPKK